MKAEDLIVDKEDEKFVKRMEEFMNLCCENTIIGENHLCDFCATARETWEKEFGTKFWNLFRWRRDKKEKGIKRFTEIFLAQINEDDYSEMDLDDIEYAIKNGLEAMFKNQIMKVFPKAIA